MAKRPGQVPPGVVLRSSWGEAARGFAQAVQEARRKRQMSTLALAEQCRISPRAIANLERGFPADPQAASAVARNLGLPSPNLEADPVYRLGLLLSQRRKRARLSLSQLASLSGVSIQTIVRVERGQCWPQRRTCAALLSVPALELRPEDFAEFARSAPVPAGQDSPRPRPASEPPAEPTEPAEPAEPAEPTAPAEPAPPAELAEPAEPTEPAAPAALAAPTPRSPIRRLAFTVRVYTDGSVFFRPGRPLPS